MASAVSFTGGKDSTLALHLVSGYSHPLLSQAGPHAAAPAVSLLVTFAPPDSDFKAHPLPVIKALAAALRIPHLVCDVGAPFLDSYQLWLRRLKAEHSITHLVTGDMLDVAAGFMDTAAAGAGVQLVRPLWQCPRRHVLMALHDLGIRSRISCVDLGKYQQASPEPVSAQAAQQAQPERQQEEEGTLALPRPADAQAPTQQCTAACGDPSAADEMQGPPAMLAGGVGGFSAAADLLGQELTQQLVAGPLSVAEQWYGADLCGEHGEYHTLVFEAPMMHASVSLVPAESRIAQSGAYRHAYIVWCTDPAP